MSPTCVGGIKKSNSEFAWVFNTALFFKNPGEKLLSPKFYTCDLCKKLQWEIWLCPFGDSKSSANNLSISLKNFNNNFNVEADVTFSLLNNNDKKVFPKKIKNCSFNGPAPWGCNNFIKLDFIKSRKSNVVKDNKLTITCEIKILTINDIEKKNSLTAKIDLNKLNELSSNLALLEKLFSNKKFSDATVKSGNRYFYLHKCIVAAQSPVFEAMFEINTKGKVQNIVEINDIRPDVLENFFLFLYTKKIDNIKTMASELLYVGEKYFVDELKDKCEYFMIGNLNEINAVNYLDTAHSNHATKLKNRAIKFIASNFNGYIKNPEFDEFGTRYPDLWIEIMRIYINS